MITVMPTEVAMTTEMIAEVVGMAITAVTITEATMASHKVINIKTVVSKTKAVVATMANLNKATSIKTVANKVRAEVIMVNLPVKTVVSKTKTAVMLNHKTMVANKATMEVTGEKSILPPTKWV